MSSILRRGIVCDELNIKARDRVSALARTMVVARAVQERAESEAPVSGGRRRGKHSSNWRSSEAHSLPSEKRANR